MKALLLTIILSIFFFVPLQAQENSGGLANQTVTCVNCTIDNNVGLEEIRVPVFASFIDFNTENASIFSWVSFIGALATVGLVIFWIFLLVKAGLKGIQSQGTPEKLAEAFKQVQSVLVGAAISLFFPLVLSIIGVFFGIGTIFSWPKMFQFCDESSGVQFYYQALLADDVKGDKSAAEAKCNPIGE